MVLENLQHLVASYGYVAVALFVLLESAGLPLPGETVLITAAIYAGTTGRLNIALVILAAVTGAVAGDNFGFLIGQRLGLPALLRWGWKIGLTEPRLRTGQYLFRLHGGKVVFFARFIGFLRVLAALLAGANNMCWRRFLIFNLAGGIGWGTGYGLAAYYFGTQIEHIAGPIGAALVLTLIALAAYALIRLHRHGKRLQEEAARAMPGPLLRRAAPLGGPK